MKNYRFLAPIILIALSLVGWYSLINQDASMKKQYEEYLSAARSSAALGITFDTMENYKAALAVYENVDLSIEAANFLITQKEHSQCIDFCEGLLEKYPVEPRIYSILVAEYLKVEDFENCLETISTAEKRKASNDEIRKIYDALQYGFKIDYLQYEDVTSFVGKYCAVMFEGRWGFIDSEGKTPVRAQYRSVTAFYGKEEDESDFRAAVVDDQGNPFFIDTEGEKRLLDAVDSKYVSFGMLVNDTFPALAESDGKYVYLNSKFEVLSSGYDFAGTCFNSVCPVSKNGEWQLVEANGTPVSDAVYSDIKVDINNIATRNSRAFVKTGSDYILVDLAGVRQGSESFEDARVFADSNSYAAVKIKGKWGFVDQNGKMVIKAQYDDAKSFSSGLAAVKIRDLWGYIDVNNKLVIKAQFPDAGGFNSDNSALVKIGSDWKLITLYKLKD